MRISPQELAPTVDERKSEKEGKGLRRLKRERPRAPLSGPSPALPTNPSSGASRR